MSDTYQVAALNRQAGALANVATALGRIADAQHVANVIATSVQVAGPGYRAEWLVDKHPDIARTLGLTEAPNV